MIRKGKQQVSKTTPATLFLDKAGVRYSLATYAYDPDADRVGLQAAEALGAPASEVLKTLKTRVSANALELARHGVPKQP